MYFNLRCKSYVISLALISSSVSFAGTMGPVSDSKGFYFDATPIYGKLSDSTIDKASFAETSNVSNNTVSVTPDYNPDWGISLSAGYLFGPGKSNDVVLTYLHLDNKGSTAINNTAPANPAADQTGDQLINKLSQLLKKEFDGQPFSDGGAVMYGPATANFHGQYELNTADLTTHRYFPSESFNGMTFSRFYGIKATGLKKEFQAQYVGNGIQFDSGNPELLPINDQISYTAKYYGIGPRIGMGADWSFARYLSLFGDVSASLLAGSYDTQFNEYLVTPLTLTGYVNTGSYSFNQRTHTAVWATGVLGANLGIGAKFDMKNQSKVGIAAGINSEQYWTEATADYISSKKGNNTLSVNNRFALRNLFIKLSYAC